jgi:hypothetical protein
MYHLSSYRDAEAFNTHYTRWTNDGWELVHMWKWEKNPLVEVLWKSDPIESDNISKPDVFYKTRSEPFMQGCRNENPS